MKIYFVTCGVREEKKTIKRVKPDNVLLSYFYWKRRNIEKFINYIGYKPNIMLDSGAYSAWSKCKNINILDYIDFIKENEQYIENYIMLDVIGEPKISWQFYKVMKQKGLSPIPVYHYGDQENVLVKYIEKGHKYIALGNTVPIKNKKTVATWINRLCEKYKDVKFHLLGSSSKKIIRGCPELYSLDSSSYILMAVNGYPKHINSKIQRAVWQMENTIEINKKDKVKQLSLITN